MHTGNFSIKLYRCAELIDLEQITVISFDNCKIYVV